MMLLINKMNKEIFRKIKVNLIKINQNYSKKYNKCQKM